MRGAGIGGRGEQPDDALLADQIAGRVETLDADIVEIDAPVHARMDIGLGDDQRTRLFQKRHDLRREFHQILAAPQHAQIARAHDAERAVEIGFERMAVEGVVAHAEESEIVGQQPLQELDRLGDLVHRQRRRIGLQFGDDCLDAFAHGAPVLHRQPHLREHAVERAHQVGARGLVLDRLEMDMDEALARGAGLVGRAKRDQLAALARYGEHRVRHQPQFEPALGEFAQHRIDQERHVVVDDLDHRDRLAFARLLERHRLAANFRRARLPLSQKIVSPLGQTAKIGRRQARYVLRHRVGVAAPGIRRNVPATLAERVGGLRNERKGGAFLLAAGRLDGQVNSHVNPAHFLHESLEARSEFSPSAPLRRGQHTIW